MDNAAGVAVFRHCRTNVVTVSVNDVQLLAPALVGDVLHVGARVQFTSGRSAEIEVVTSIERFGLPERIVCARGLFNFVSLGPDGKTLPMPQVAHGTPAAAKRFGDGKARYLAERAARQAQAQAQAVR